MFGNNNIAIQFRLFGFPVIIEWMHVLFIGLIGIMNGINNPQIGFLVGCALFISVFVHELGHAFMCMLFRVPIKELRLVALGGYVSHGGGLRHMTAFLITLAGPAANLLLIIGCLALARNATTIQMAYFAQIMILWNVMLLVFNLFPIVPLDGGKLVHRVLHMIHSRSFSGKVVSMKRWKRTPDQITGLIGLYASYAWIVIAIILFMKLGIIAFFIPNFHLQRALAEGRMPLPL